MVVGSLEVLGKEEQVGLRRTRTPRSADPKPDEYGEESVGLPKTPFFGLQVDGRGEEVHLNYEQGCMERGTHHSLQAMYDYVVLHAIKFCGNKTL